MDSSKFPLDVIHTMNKQSKVCNYLDIPLQHATDRMLLAMKRQINQKETVELIQSIRQIIPDISLRTTMLVGFPGETEEDFEELCEFIKEHKFDRLGVFQYSHEEDTSAHDLIDSVSSEIKEYRAQRLMQIQEDISYELNEKKRGKKYKVIIDRLEGEYFIGRTEGDSPEVDNEVLISAKQYVRIGDFVNVIIRDSTHFDLIGICMIQWIFG